MNFSKIAQVVGIVANAVAAAATALQASGTVQIIPAAYLNVTAQPGAADGVTVDLKAFGIATACGAAGAGIVSAHCTQIDEKACGLAIVTNPDPNAEDLFAMVADETRAVCPHGKERP